MSRKLIRVNTQPVALSNLQVWASHSHSLQPAEIRNFHYESIRDQLFSSKLLDRSFYKGTKNSPIEGGQWENHKPAFAIDDAVDHSQVAGNYRSKADVKPWFEIELTEAVDVAGLEVTTFGAEDNDRFRNVVFRAGLTQSPVHGAGSGNSLLTHNDFILKYTGTANTAGEVLYIMFPTPVGIFFGPGHLILTLCVAEIRPVHPHPG